MARMTPPQVERVRRAIQATLDRRTARLQMRIESQFLGEPVAYSAAGVVDFARGRHLTGEGDELVITAGDRQYRRLPDGRWQGRPGGGDGPPMLNGPSWMLHALRGVIAAESRRRELVGSVEVEYFECRVDLLDADARSQDGVRVPPEYVLRELRDMPGHVWIGDDGLVRRVRSPISVDIHEFDFWDFSVPDPLELPPDHLLVDPDRQFADEIASLTEPEEADD
jgi:hypothetical protein